MSIGMRSVSPTVVALAAALLVGGVAEAAPPSSPDDDAKKRAHAAFELGNQQSERGDYAAAAHSFALADELSPNKVALESALDTSILANDVPLGAELLERAQRDPKLSPDILKRAHAAFDGRAGRVEIRCVATCAVRIDGATVEDRSVWLKIGPHHVSIREGEFALEKDVDVATAGMSLEVDRTPRPDAPKPPPVEEPKPSSRILHPAFAYVGIGVTAGLVAGAIASAVDTGNIHAAFEAASIADKPALAEEGLAAQTRTNVLIGVSAGLGAVTLALGLLAVPWGGGDKKPAAVSLGIGLGGAALRGAF